MSLGVERSFGRRRESNPSSALKTLKLPILRMPENCRIPRLPDLRTIRAQRISETPRTQQLLLPIHSADDLKYSLTFIHQFHLQWPGMGDSSFGSVGDSPHLIDNLLFVLEGKRLSAAIDAVDNQIVVTSRGARGKKPLNAFLLAGNGWFKALSEHSAHFCARQQAARSARIPQRLPLLRRNPETDCRCCSRRMTGLEHACSSRLTLRRRTGTWLWLPSRLWFCLVQFRLTSRVRKRGRNSTRYLDGESTPIFAFKAG